MARTIYNYFRDYDPVVGRYVESDPIGLAGGINTYGNVKANPLMLIDPLGLKVQRCCRKASFQFGSYTTSLGVNHCWIKTDTVIAGMGNHPQKCTRPGDNAVDLPFTPVFVSEHACDTPDKCEDIHDVDEECVNRQLAIGRHLGRFIPGYNDCQTLAKDVFKRCKKR